MNGNATHLSFEVAQKNQFYIKQPIIVSWSGNERDRAGPAQAVLHLKPARFEKVVKEEIGAVYAIPEPPD